MQDRSPRILSDLWEAGYPHYWGYPFCGRNLMILKLLLSLGFAESSQRVAPTATSRYIRSMTRLPRRSFVKTVAAAGVGTDSPGVLDKARFLLADLQRPPYVLPSL